MTITLPDTAAIEQLAATLARLMTAGDRSAHHASQITYRGGEKTSELPQPENNN